VRTNHLLYLFLVFCCVGANAQEHDRVEVFGGYSYTGYSVNQIYSGPWTKYGFNGWDASVAFKLSPNVAAEGDFGAGFASNGGGQSYSFQTYMGGLRFSGGVRKINIFGHILFGGLHFNADYGNPATSFATALGGGADFWFSRRIGVRLIQADCLLNTNRSAAEVNIVGGPGPRAHLRIATGITFRF
jgi:hypothetical protein